jgi:tRNA U34 5-carboxymethylaminomethyl modifying GTPase MnmE/TrmE
MSKLFFSKSAASSNELDAELKKLSGQALSQRILVEISRLYSASSFDEDGPKDLCTYAEKLGRYASMFKELPQDMIQKAIHIRSPKDRITCLMVGNHSAGKSSFVNWYIGEKIQNESVAIETAGFTVIRKGKSRTSWKGAQVKSRFHFTVW